MARVKITVTKPTPAEVYWAEVAYLVRSFDGPMGIEPPYQATFLRRLSTTVPGAASTTDVEIARTD